MTHSGSLIPVALLAFIVTGQQSVQAETTVSVVSPPDRFQVQVRSFLEMRERNLVRQGWDISCGAAALSTILTHDYETPYSEATIAVSILANTDPALVRQRGGFSLLDLKRFAEAAGFTANGYGDLALKDLINFKAPLILPVRIRGLDHFVVFRGVAAGKVLLGDPAFGNLTLSRQQFLEFWTSEIGFIVEPQDAQDKQIAALSAEAMHLTVPDLNYIYRLSRGAGPVPTTGQ